MFFNADAAQHPDGLICCSNARGLSKNMAYRIVNIANGYRLKLSAALRAIEECSAAWVDPGVSIRSLTLAESIAARNEQAARREPLPYAEVPGLRFDPPATGIHATRRESVLTWEAHTFAMTAV